MGMNMIKHLAPLALTAAFVISGATAASAQQGWSRSKTVTGPYGGTYSAQGSGSCAGGSCASRQAWTGPAGRTVSRSGSASCSGGICTGSATWTGPRGNTESRSRRVPRY
jgi:hypothetical protein